MEKQPLEPEVFTNTAKALERHRDEVDDYEQPEVEHSYTTDVGPLYGRVVVLASASRPVAAFAISNGILSWSPGALDWLE